MKQIREDFRKILSGLSYQNAGDCLSRREKLALLDDESVKQNIDNVAVIKHEGYELDSQRNNSPAKSAV
jgi:hypothetical protein